VRSKPYPVGNTTWEPRVWLETGETISWPSPPFAAKPGAATYGTLLQWFPQYNEIYNQAVPTASAYDTYQEMLTGNTTQTTVPRPSTAGMGMPFNSMWSNGSEVILQDLDGWFGSGPVESKAVALDTAYGQIVTRPNVKARQVTIEGTVVSPDRAALRDMAFRIGGTLGSAPHAGVLNVQDPDWGLWRLPVVRVDKTDIRIEGDTQLTFRINLEGRMMGSQGRGVWLEGPDHHTSLTVSPYPLTYEGMVTGKPRLIMTGPLPAGAVIRFLGNGINPSYQMRFPKELLDGYTLDVNVAARDVRLNGGFNAAGTSAFEYVDWSNSTWPVLNVDAVTTITCQGIGAAVVQLFWTDLA
jgi:hypothetical protein